VTCIVGVAEAGRVWIGGDSSACSGYSTRPTALRKVFRVDTTARETLLIGYCGSFRMGQLLQYSLDLTAPRKGDALEYLVTVVMERVRVLFRDAGFATVSNNQESGGLFLLGYEGGLYRVCSDYQVNPMLDGYDAIGCGDESALGALHALRNMDPQDRLVRALQTAEHFSGSVCAPFVVESIGET
jgi:ATP-dependent protease HslVU (ClpYQ) peptidase subunit